MLTPSEEILRCTMAVTSLLSYCREPDRPSLPAWSLFLDALCHLCDDRPDGDSICSLAGVKVEHCRILLFATQSRAAQEAFQHLVWLLDIITQASCSPHTDWKQLEVMVLKKCLARSAERVDKYKSELEWRLRKLRKRRCDEQTEVMLDDLIALFCNVPGNEDLCERAWDFRLTDLSQRLKAHCSTGPDVRIRREVAHYIGRLRAWHRAVKIVTTIAAKPKVSALLQALRVVHIDLRNRPKQARFQPQSQSVDVDRVISNVFPDLPPELAISRLESVRKTFRPALEPCDLAEVLSNIMTRPFGCDVHVEVALADYIHEQGLPFFDKYRYIGCSKPSCYCCSQYLRLHPLDLATRPSHNRVWQRWAYPASPAGVIGFTKFCQAIRKETQRTLLFGDIARHHLRDSVTDQAVSSKVINGFLLSELGSLRSL